MSNPLQTMPDYIVAIALLSFSSLVLLDEWGMIQAGFLIQIAALCAIGYGFMLLNGPKRLRALLEKTQHRRD